MNLDPLTSLALSMENNKGVYALLLGSGVSHAANIKTGWGIMTDLIMKIAHVKGAAAEAEQDPVAWFTETFEEEPGYSSLLEMQEPTQATRSSLIAPYFERSAEDEENGDKQPTNAHRAIAKLVKAGYIKVILTTNFDRLMEQALEDASIQPTVIANSNDIPGAMPLVHERACTIIKLHGDYKDLDTKNTYEELESYDDALNGYIDRIFDDYGLIICGWSGEWDTALRNAIQRCPNRRFQTYWISRGEHGDKAREIIDHRKAQPIPTAGADELFEELEEKVRSIAEYRQVHPVTVQIASATVKRYLAEDKHRIKLHDFVMQEVDRFLEATKDPTFNRDGKIDEILERYLNQAEMLLHIFAIGGYWSNDGDIEIWQKALKKIPDTIEQNLRHSRDGKILYRFIVASLIYAFGMGALAANKHFSAIRFLQSCLLDFSDDRGITYYPDIIRNISCHGHDDTTGSNTVFKHLVPPLHGFLQHITGTTNIFDATPTPFNQAFDRIEYFTDIIFYGRKLYLPIGQKYWKIQHQTGLDTIFDIVHREICRYGENWPPLKAGLCNGSLENFKNTHNNYVEKLEGVIGGEIKRLD